MEWLSHLLFSLKLLGLTALIFALANPFSREDHKQYIQKNFEGIDIVIAMDVSSSMLAMDFKPNRLESAKHVAYNFISERINDRIGLVIYEGDAYTKCPLTTDYKILKKIIPIV